MKRSIHVFIGIMLFLSVEANQITENFVALHMLPSALADVLQKKEHTVLKQLRSSWPKVVTLPELPEYIIKTNISRVVGSDIVKTAIESGKLTLLTVPVKYLYHLCGRSDALTDDNYLVVVHKVQKGSPFLYTKKHLMQLLDLFEIAGFVDFYTENIVPLDDYRLAIIDTELKSFRKKEDINRDYIGIKFGVLLQLAKLPFDNEAQDLLKKFISIYKPFTSKPIELMVDWDLMDRFAKALDSQA